MLLESALAKMRARHMACEEGDCDECMAEWPCDAARLLAEVDRLQAELADARRLVEEVDRPFFDR